MIPTTTTTTTLCNSTMAIITTLAFLLHLLFAQGFCKPYLPTGYKFTIPIPPGHDASFRGKAFIVDAGSRRPNFRAGLMLAATEKNYSCSVSVFFGEVMVWSSGHLVQFRAVKSCIMELTEDGDLQVKDGVGRVGWQSRTSGIGVEKLMLEKSGNLILVDAKNRTKWQSFDRPADVLLRGQQLNVPFRLVSFPPNSPAFFSFEFESDKITLNLNWRGSKHPYWQSKPRRNQTIFSAKLGAEGLKLFDRSSKKIMQIKGNSTKPIKFLAFMQNGDFRLYRYSSERGEFEASYEAIGKFCDLPLACGTYGVCTYSNGCTCISSPTKCYHSEPGFCLLANPAAEMVELGGVDTVLRNSSVRFNVSKSECVDSCMTDCSCASARYSNGECLHYGLVGGARQVGGEERAYSYWVKVPKGGDRIHGRDSSGFNGRILIWFGVFDGVALCLIVVGVVCFFFRIRKRTSDSGTSANL